MPTVKVSLSKNQESLGKRNFKKGTPSTFRITNVNLKGSTEFSITDSEFNRYQKALQNNKGLNLTGNLVMEGEQKESVPKSRSKSKKPEITPVAIPLLTQMTSKIVRPSIIDPTEAEALSSLQAQPSTSAQVNVPDTLLTNQTGKGAFTPGRSYQSGNGAYTPGRSYQSGSGADISKTVEKVYKNNNLRRRQDFLFH